MTRLEIVLLMIAGLGVIFIKIYNPAVYSEYESVGGEFDYAKHITNTRKLEEFYFKQVATLKKQVESMAQKYKEAEKDLLELSSNVSKYEKLIIGTGFGDCLQKPSDNRGSTAEKQFSKNITSCRDVKSAGWYSMDVSANSSIRVYCEPRLYGGGWTLIQNRFDGSVNFYRNWISYRNVFGSSDGEFWLGLENIYKLTSQRNYDLLVLLTDFEGNMKYAYYDKFAIGNETEWYNLKTLGSFEGSAGDFLGHNRGQNFSTHDVDVDKSKLNCAVLNHGAWWYKDCGHSNLNGMYKHSDGRKRMYWHYQLFGERLAASQMLIREVQ